MPTKRLEQRLCAAGPRVTAHRVAVLRVPRRHDHRHLVCRSCGPAVDVECAVHDANCLRPPPGHGFVLEEAEVTCRGLRPRCQDQIEGSTSS